MDWNEKYRPRYLNEIVGNRKAISRFNDWMNDFLEGKTKKAALLYGPTGVGKTSSVYAIANELDFDVIELNASDQRNYQVIKKIAGSAVKNYSINKKNKIILFDESDNLSGISDKNGARGIREILEKSIYPVILTANNIKKVPQEVKNLCIFIKFDKLKNSEVLFVLKNICIKEGIDVDIQVLREITKKNQDLRAAINDIYALSAGATNINASILSLISEREHTEDIFSLLGSIFYDADYSVVTQILSKIDETPDDVIQWINENLFEICDKDVEMLAILDNLSKADIYLGRTYIKQNYKFWRYAIDLMLVGAQTSTKKNQKNHFSMNFPKRWIFLGRTKQERDLTDGICYKIAKMYNISMKKAKSQVLPFLKKIYDNGISDKLKKEVGLTDKEISFIFNENGSKKSYSKLKMDKNKKEVDLKDIKSIKPKKDKIQKNLSDF